MKKFSIIHKQVGEVIKSMLGPVKRWEISINSPEKILKVKSWPECATKKPELHKTFKMDDKDFRKFSNMLFLVLPKDTRKNKYVTEVSLSSDDTNVEFLFESGDKMSIDVSLG